MNTDLSSAAKCFAAWDTKGSPVAFCAVLHQPHGKHKNLKRCTRLVVLPDYQGCGIGYKFLTAVAEQYGLNGYDFSIVTSAKNLAYKLGKSDKWRCVHIGRNKCSSIASAIDYDRKTIRKDSNTASFQYKRGTGEHGKTT